nr:uncharacterized protein At4g04775-like [Arachis hypogaea]
MPGGYERDRVAPKCYCGVFAIMYKSRTTSNPNRVFLRCPFFKAKEPYCRYFVWLDEHLKKLRAVEPEALGAVDEAEGVDVDEQLFRNQNMKKKIEELERKLLSIERKKNEFVAYYCDWCSSSCCCCMYLERVKNKDD